MYLVVLFFYQICQLSAQKSVQDELLDRLKSLEKRINELKLQNDEVM